MEISKAFQYANYFVQCHFTVPIGKRVQGKVKQNFSLLAVKDFFLQKPCNGKTMKFTN